jgi:hypothetical protein
VQVEHKGAYRSDAREDTGIRIEEVNVLILDSVKKPFEIDRDHLEFDGRVEALTSTRGQVVCKNWIVFCEGSFLASNGMNSDAVDGLVYEGIKHTVAQVAIRVGVLEGVDIDCFDKGCKCHGHCHCLDKT